MAVELLNKLLHFFLNRFDKLKYDSAFALSDEFDSTVTKVSYKPRHVEASSHVARSVTKPDSLNVAREPYGLS